MLSKIHSGFTLPVDELPIPPGQFQKLNPATQRAFLVALSSVVANYVEYRRQSVDMANVPEEDGSVAMRQLIRLLVRGPDLHQLEPLMILPALIFSGLDEYLDRKGIEFVPGSKIGTITHLSSAGTPTIRYEPDRWIEVTWNG